MKRNFLENLKNKNNKTNKNRINKKINEQYFEQISISHEESGESHEKLGESHEELDENFFFPEESYNHENDSDEDYDSSPKSPKQDTEKNQNQFFKNNAFCINYTRPETPEQNQNNQEIKNPNIREQWKQFRETKKKIEAINTLKNGPKTLSKLLYKNN